MKKPDKIKVVFHKSKTRDKRDDILEVYYWKTYSDDLMVLMSGLCEHCGGPMEMEVECSREELNEALESI